MKSRSVCTVAVATLRRRPLLGLAAGVGALAAIRPLVPGAGMRLLQVTPSLNVARIPARALQPSYRSQSTLAGLFSLSQADSIMASLNPPQAAPKWSHTPDEVLALTKAAIDDDRAILDKVAALKPEECTFESVRSPVGLCSPCLSLPLICGRSHRVVRCS